ncbi:hypothetical protein NIES2100_77700 [Calothrix sp. NIES-2100]|nr:hypothetical protein NIES2100_77700 [Calothrix sp. NIES-2100]
MGKKTPHTPHISLCFLVPPKFCSSFAQRLPLGEDVGVRAASPLGEARRSYLATAALTPDAGAQTSLLVLLVFLVPLISPTTLRRCASVN